MSREKNGHRNILMSGAKESNRLYLMNVRLVPGFLVAGCVNNPTSAFMVGLGRLNGLLVT